ENVEVSSWRHLGALPDFPSKFMMTFFCSSAHFGALSFHWHPSGFASKMSDDLFLANFCSFWRPLDAKMAPSAPCTLGPWSHWPHRPARHWSSLYAKVAFAMSAVAQILGKMCPSTPELQMRLQAVGLLR